MSQTATATATAPLSDYDAILATMQGYINGVLQGRSDLMKPSFHPAASFFGHYDGQTLAGSIQMLFDWADNNGPATGTRTVVGEIDIRDSIALVRLEMEGMSGKLSLGGDARLSDYFTLLKTEGQWLISHKTFHWH